MIQASIVSIGNELLSGHTVDTNASYLSRQLLTIGIPVVAGHTVGDDLSAIKRALHMACSDADIVVVTGGLGPTDDDLTRQAVAEFLGTKLQLQQDLLQRIEEFFARRNVSMPARNRIQAFIPAGANAIDNELGTAPGIAAKRNGNHLFLLPGVPSEMKQMFETSVLPELRGRSQGQAVVVRKLKCFGAGESAIADLLGPLMQRGRNPLVNSTVDMGIVTLHVIAQAETEDRAAQLAQDDEKLLRDKLGSLVFGQADQTLAEVVGRQFSLQGKTLAVAESCTGGLLCKMLTDVPGASDYLTYGWITYSNQAKITELGLSADLIETYGAVSEQVAQAMARGARRKAHTDYAVATTGIAGPTGDTEHKPVGLVYIAVDCEHGSQTERHVFSHGREGVRLRAAQTALNLLRLKLAH
jgi:nicotinamide-nucleotide amidase